MTSASGERMRPASSWTCCSTKTEHKDITKVDAFREMCEVKLLALTLDERAIMLSSLEDPPKALAELRAVLLADPPVAPARRPRFVRN